MDAPRSATTEELLEHADWVGALARSLARDDAGADDLAQATLGAALARPPAADRPLRPWLRRVATNLARRERRGDARRRAREIDVARAESAPGPDELLARLEEQQRLARHVARLPEPYRETILRHYWNGESCADIARAAGLGEASVRSRLARGRALLRERLEADLGRRRAHALVLVAAGLRRTTPPPLAAPLALLTMAKTSPWIPAALALTVVGAGALVLVNLDRGEPLRPEGLTRAEATREAPADLPGAEAVSAPEQPVERSAVEAPAAAADTAAVEPTAPAAGATTVSARALDEQGRPLAGAVLFATDEDGLPHPGARSAPADAEGRVALELTRGTWFQYAGRETGNAHLALVAPRHAATFFVGTVTPRGEHDQGVFSLQPGGTARGRVHASGGPPPAGTVVVASLAPLDASDARAALEGPPGAAPRPATRPDAAGAFELDGLPLGRVRLWARAPGHVWTHSAEVEVRRDEALEEIELALRPAGAEARITGRVLDPAGVPVAGARVTWMDPETYDPTSVECDAGGRFQVDVHASVAHGLAALDPGGRFGPSPRVRAAPGEADVVLTLTPRREFALRVVDAADGAPLEGASCLAVIADDHADSLDQPWRKTDAEGRVELLARAAAFAVYVSADGFARAELGPLEPDALPVEALEVRLERPDVLRGRVLHGGTGVPGAKIELVRDLGERSREVQVGFPSRYDSVWRSSESDAEGRFALEVREVEPDERYALLVMAEGFAQAELVLDALDTSPEAEPVEVELVRGGSVEGRVLVHPGRSAEGVVVGLSRGDGKPHFVRSDAAGAFRVEHLTPGPWRIEDRSEFPEDRTLNMARADEMPFEWNLEVREGEATWVELDLRWQEDLRVAGRLVLGGVPAEGWSAQLRSGRYADRPFELAPTRLDAEGRFRAEARPDRLGLVLLSPADEPPLRRISLAVRVDQDLEPLELAFSTGRVVGRAKPGARLRLVQGRMDALLFEVEFEADAEGFFDVQGAPAGELSLQPWRDAEFGPGWYQGKSLHLPAGGEAEVELP